MSHLYPADLLLPDPKRVDLSRYAVIACDQFTSEPAYWQATEETVGEAPSALRMILPELFLSERESRVPAIHAAMRAYSRDLLVKHPASVVYLRRECGEGGAVREGLVLAIDLLDYDFSKGTVSPIRPTEGTVTDRIPPRLEVRRGAPLELPHVMLLVERGEEIFAPCRAMADTSHPLYDIPLMQGGGRAVGYLLGEAEWASVDAALSAHEARATEQNPTSPLLYAVGDGNHSLATAKAHFLELRERLGEAALTHPARYALVELCALDSPALVFHPIYRAVFGADPEALLSALAEDASESRGFGRQTLTVLLPSGETRELVYPSGRHPLTVGTLQQFLDGYTAEHPEITVDYIHGEDSLASIVRESGAVGFLFDGMSKDELFPAVSASGALPRKTFSMGEATEKRYYLEAREIV